MKKLQVLVVVAGLLIAGSAAAQTKIGYIRIDDIVGLMPELSRQKIDLDTVGQQFVRDSILPEITYKQTQYNEKLAQLQDTVKYSAAVRTVILKDIQGLQEELQGADQYVQQVLQAKQQQFLQPYYVKAKNAIDAVAKKKGYTHVLNTDVFLVAPATDDLSESVLAELKIPLPKQNTPAAGNKPPAKTN